MEKKIMGRRNSVVVIAAFMVLILIIILIPKNGKEAGQLGLKDQWLNIELTYLGSAKGEETGWVLNENHDIKRFRDGGLEYAISGYAFFSDFDYFNNYIKKWNGIYDEDFTAEEREGMNYVCVYGRRMEWLQYNPGRKSMSGAFANRAGIDWEMEQEHGNVYFYMYKDSGFLADMSMEVFYDADAGKVYSGSATERMYLE